MKLREFRNYLLEPYALELPLSDINIISAYSVDLKVKQAWLDLDQSELCDDSDLVEITADHYGDARVGESAVGKIIDENQDMILLELVNNVGQFESYTVLNKRFVVHISEDSDLLTYLSFANRYQLEMGTYDPHVLTKAMPTLQTDFSKMFIKKQ